MIGSGVLFVGLFVLLRLLVGTVWFGVSGLRSLEGTFDVVWNEETSYRPELYVSGVWVAAMLHRLGILLLGWRTNPNSVGVLYSGRVRVVGCEGRFWALVWLWLIILLGFAEPCEAQKRESALLSRLGSSDEQAPMDTTPWREDWMLAPSGAHYGLVAKSSKERYWCDFEENRGVGGYLQGTEVERESKLIGLVWEAVKIFLIVASWETFKWGACRRKRIRKTALIQTDEGGIVPLPLPDGVPNRARIMYSLWRAGYDVDVGAYPEDEQAEYFSLVGRRLRSLSEASS